MDTKHDLFDFTEDEITSSVTAEGYKPFHGKQIFKWLYRNISSIDEMTDLSLSMREKLKEKYKIEKLEIEKKLVSEYDGTVKYLFRLADGNFIETVVMKYSYANSICVSSQIGCNMGCRFCASTIGGKIRDLTSGEIIKQILAAECDLGIKISNIVIMGMGEPLDNYDNVIKFLKTVNNKNGLNIGYRHITLSTCGIVDKIYALAEEKLPITLSVSLHSPFDADRSKLMPVNKKYPLAVLYKAIGEYIKTTGRRISIEYALINEENDTFCHADELIRLFSGMLIHINIIPVNPVEKRNFKKSTPERVKKFTEYLNKNGLTATVRRKLGDDINAACGQLRKQMTK